VQICRCRQGGEFGGARGRLRELLGKESLKHQQTLGGATANLTNRLNALSQAFDEKQTERLRASVQLLSCDIDVANAEAKRLEAFEAEERAADIGGENVLEDMPAERVAALHTEIANLDGVALRISDIDKQLIMQEATYRQFAEFSEDLAAAEARNKNTIELLQVTLSAAQTMKVAVKNSGEQLQKNMKVLEAKVEVRNAQAKVKQEEMEKEQAKADAARKARATTKSDLAGPSRRTNAALG